MERGEIETGARSCSQRSGPPSAPRPAPRIGTSPGRRAGRGRIFGPFGLPLLRFVGSSEHLVQLDQAVGRLGGRLAVVRREGRERDGRSAVTQPGVPFDQERLGLGESPLTEQGRPEPGPDQRRPPAGRLGFLVDGEAVAQGRLGLGVPPEADQAGAPSGPRSRPRAETPAPGWHAGPRGPVRRSARRRRTARPPGWSRPGRTAPPASGSDRGPAAAHGPRRRPDRLPRLPPVGHRPGAIGRG